MVEGNATGLTDHFQTLNWLLNELDSTKQKFLELSAEKQKYRHTRQEAQSYKYLAGRAEAAWAKCEKYYKKADDTAAYYAAIVLNPTLKMKWFEQQWEDSTEKQKWILTVENLVKELWLEYKGKYSSSLSNLPTLNPLLPQPQSVKTYTSARAHKRLKVSHLVQSIDQPDKDSFKSYLETNCEPVSENEQFDVLQYWLNRYESQPDLARFALDILVVPPMSDECERLFSSCKILLEDRRSRLRMDIIEANECLRHSYGPPRKGAFDDQEVGEVEGEPAAPFLSPAQASAARKAAEALPQPPEVVGKAWGEGLEEEFSAIEGFEVEDILGDEVEVIEDDEIIEGGSEGGGEQI